MLIDVERLRIMQSSATEIYEKDSVSLDGWLIMLNAGNGHSNLKT